MLPDTQVSTMLYYRDTSRHLDAPGGHVLHNLTHSVGMHLYYLEYRLHVLLYYLTHR